MLPLFDVVQHSVVTRSIVNSFIVSPEYSITHILHSSGIILRQAKPDQIMHTKVVERHEQIMVYLQMSEMIYRTSTWGQNYTE